MWMMVEIIAAAAGSVFAGTRSNLLHYASGGDIKPGSVTDMETSFGENAQARVTAFAATRGSRQIWAVATITGKSGSHSVILNWTPA
jgi:hypothetical protein